MFFKLLASFDACADLVSSWLNRVPQMDTVYAEDTPFLAGEKTLSYY